jgi:hypothetical protein
MAFRPSVTPGGTVLELTQFADASPVGNWRGIGLDNLAEMKCLTAP